MKSLLGRDEEFVIERIQTMIRNEEIVGAQKEEIEILKSDLDKLKEENYHLASKLEYKREIIQDMETELDKFETRSKDEKNKIALNEKELDELQEFIAKQVEEINILRDNNLSMVSQISENSRMEKQIDIQNKVIKDLKDRLKDAEKVDLTMEVEKLLLEVENLQKENEEKVKLLQNIEQENQTLADNLKIEQDEKHALIENKEQVGDNLSLAEELSLVSQIPIKFPCELCGKGFVKRISLKFHHEVDHGKQHRLNILNEKFVSLESKVLHQKYILMSSLSNLQEKDMKRKHVCHCAGVCRINHRIYNWSRPRSEPLVCKSKDVLKKQEPKIFQCQNCGKCFKNAEQLNTHEEALHCIETCLVNPWGLNFLQ